MLIKFESRFKKKLRGRIENFRFEVGILNDGPHSDAKAGTSATYAGGPIRRRARLSEKSISEVSKDLRARLGFNYLTEPFKDRSSDIIKFTEEFLKLAFNRSQKRRVENLLQAVVRNPILRGDYGSNSAATQKIKGFDRKMIDTSQLFKAIKAICKAKT